MFLKQQSNEGVLKRSLRNGVVSSLQIYMRRLYLQELLKLHNELGDIIIRQHITYSKYNADYF